MKSVRFSILIWLITIATIFLSGCQAQAPIPTATPSQAPTAIPATETQTPTKVLPTETPIPLPSATSTPAVLNGAEQPIIIQDYSIVIVYNGLIDIGYNPTGGSSTMALNFTVSEESGKLDEISALNALITDSQGNWINTSFAESGTNYKGEFTLNYNIFAVDETGSYYLHFPTGEMIDLTPLIK